MSGVSDLRKSQPVKWLTVTAMLMALNIAMSSFGVPVPGGHLYLNDAVICTAAILLDPLGAFFVGGVGAFLGDFFFYPAPMFVSLVTHGLQAVVVSLCAHKLAKEHRGRAALVGVILGVIINVAGYSVGRALVYATPEAAMLKFPFQVFQATFGAVVSMLLGQVFSALSDFQEKTAERARGLLRGLVLSCHLANGTAFCYAFGVTDQTTTEHRRF